MDSRSALDSETAVDEEDRAVEEEEGAKAAAEATTDARMAVFMVGWCSVDFLLAGKIILCTPGEKCE